MKPTCTECKHRRRPCERPRRRSITRQIVLDSRVEVSKPAIMGTVSPWDDAVPKGQQEPPPGPLKALGEVDIVRNPLTKSLLYCLLTARQSQSNPLLIELDSQSISELTSCLQSPEKAALLIQAFIFNVNLLVPLKIAHKSIEDLAVHRTTPFTQCTPHLLCLLLAVLYSGAITTPTLLSHEEMTSIYLIYLKLQDAAEISPSQKPESTLQFLQSYLIIQTTRTSWHFPSPNSISSFLPKALHIARSLGLNNDTELDNDTTSNSSTTFNIPHETKRKIWWYILYLLTSPTLSPNIRPAISNSTYTTRLPKLILDASLWDTTPKGCQQHSTSMTVAMHGRSLLTQKLQIWRTTPPCETEISQFEQAIEGLLRLIPEMPATEWPRLYLGMQKHQALFATRRDGLTSHTSDSYELLSRFVYSLFFAPFLLFVLYALCSH